MRSCKRPLNQSCEADKAMKHKVFLFSLSQVGNICALSTCIKGGRAFFMPSFFVHFYLRKGVLVMGNEVKVTAHDDYAFSPVPENERRGLFSMSSVMLGFTFFAASMWVGGTLGNGFKLWPDLVAVILTGNLILGIYGSFLGYAAASTNLSTHILARRAFGLLGSKLPSFMLAFTQVGWFGVGVAMLAYPVNKLMGWPLTPVIIVSGILMTATVAIGFKAIEWLSKIAVPAIIILGSLSIWRAIETAGGFAGMAALTPKEPLPFALGVSLGIGSFISGCTLTPDFVRYAKNKSVGTWATIIGFTFGNSLMFFFGALGAMTTGIADTAEVLASQGLLGSGIALLALNIWTTNDNALYASGLGLANITGLPRKLLTVIAGLTGTVLATFLYNNFVGWLTFLSISLPPIGGIIIGDFYLKWRCRYPQADYPLKSVNWAAMVAWGAALGVAQLSTRLNFGIAPLNSILTAMVVFVIADRLIYSKEAQ